MRIAVDLDNVLENLTQSILYLYNNESGEALQLTDIKEYYMEKFMIEPFCDNMDKYFKQAVDYMLPIAGAQEYLSKLYDEGHEIYVVTSSYFESMKEKYRWLVRNFPFIQRENVIVCHNKQLIKCDIMIDDYIPNLINGDYTKILLDYPWNRDIDDKANMLYRVNNWEEIYKIVSLINNSNINSNEESDE